VGVPERGDCVGGGMRDLVTLLMTHHFLLGFGAGMVAVYLLNATLVICLFLRAANWRE